MDIFISWSGPRSHVIAEGLRLFLPRVIQSLEPWLSSADIERGARWRTEVSDRLERSRVGIFCLTPENLSSPWMQFEAGAISKNLENTLVCTYLYDLDKSDVREPLAQFQATLAEKEETRQLLHSINGQLEPALDAGVLDDTFEVMWPNLEQAITGVPEPGEVSEPQRL